MTPAAKALGAPFKPYFGLSGLGCLPDLFVVPRACDVIALSEVERAPAVSLSIRSGGS